MKPFHPETFEPAVEMRLLTLQQDSTGRWRLIDSEARIGGLFFDLKSARRFLRIECLDAAIIVLENRPHPA